MAIRSHSYPAFSASCPPQISVLDSNSANLRMLTKSAEPAAEPSWSSDGAVIAFVKAVGKLGGRVNVFKMDAAGGKVQRLTAGPVQNRLPAFSPDGSKMAFQSNRSGNYEIYLMQLK